MATQTQWRGGSTQEHSNFTGANREITVDTDKETVVVHDGSQTGGFPLAREDLSNVEKQTLVNKLAIDKLESFDPVALIEKEKAKLKKELNQKIKSLMISGEALFDEIKSAVIASVHERELLENNMPLGTVLPYAGNSAPEGFLLLDSGTIGSYESNAVYNNDCYQDLYQFLWENIDIDCLVISDGTKGESALADWQAGKTMALPDLQGRSIIGAGLGSGLSNRVLGSTGGAETHTLTTDEMPSHSHSLGCQLPGGGENSRDEFHQASGTRQAHSSTGGSGGNAAHNNMPPWLALSWIIKY